VPALAAKARPCPVEIATIRTNLLFIGHGSYSFDMHRMMDIEKSLRQMQARFSTTHLISNPERAATRRSYILTTPHPSFCVSLRVS
jgi:hypothetical protein